MTVASFVVAQRTEHGVSHALSCRALELPISTFYKRRDRRPTAREQRRAEFDVAVRASFDDSGGTPGTYGSPRVFEDLVEAGWIVSVNTVAASMARQGLVARSPKRKRRSLMLLRRRRHCCCRNRWRRTNQSSKLPLKLLSKQSPNRWPWKRRLSKPPLQNQLGSKSHQKKQSWQKR